MCVCVCVYNQSESRDTGVCLKNITKMAGMRKRKRQLSSHQILTRSSKSNKSVDEENICPVCDSECNCVNFEASASMSAKNDRNNVVVDLRSQSASKSLSGLRKMFNEITQNDSDDDENMQKSDDGSGLEGGRKSFKGESHFTTRD